MSVSPPLLHSPFQYKHMCFSGGSVQGICFIGGLYALEHHFSDWQSQVHTYVGSSFGGLLATFLCLDYTPREIIEWVIRTPFDKLISTHHWLTGLTSPQTFFGMDDATTLLTFIKERFHDKGWIPHLTFEELYQATGRTLRMTGTSVTKGKTMWFDHIHTPMLHIIDAVQMTIAIPFLFSAVPYSDDWIVDGALSNFYPIDSTIATTNKTGESTLGFCLDVSYRTSELPFTTFDTYMFAILETMLHRYQPSLFPQNSTTIWFSHLPPVHLAQFDLSIQQKKKLLECGYDCVSSYFDNLR